MKIYKKKGQLLVIVLVVGFLIGIIYENIMTRNFEFTVEIFRAYHLEKHQNVSIISEEFFWYVAKIRFTMILIILVLGSLKWKKLFVASCIGYIGFLSGILAVAAILQMGIKGLLICVGGMMPHMLFYIPVYMVILCYLYEYPKRNWNWTKTIFTILAFFIGIVTEAYLNPVLMKIMLKMI